MSATTIRCTINDLMDTHEREGMRVHHGYDQERAIASVKRVGRERASQKAQVSA